MHELQLWPPSWWWNNPLHSSICKNQVEGEKRSHPSSIKDSLQLLELVTSIVDSYAHERATCKDLRLATICVISFACLIHPDESIVIKASDIIVHSDYIIIKKPRSKSDVYHGGHDVFLAKQATITCPYNMLLTYLGQAHVLNSSKYVFTNAV